ncbi:MAG: glycosyltransferase family 9 protein [Pseudobdellovibrionaceae bacterium]
MEKIYEIQKKDKASYKAALQALSSWEFDLLLSPHESLTSALFARKVKAKTKIGFRSWWNFAFFGERIRKEKSLPDALRQMSLLQEHDPTLKKQLQDFRRQDLEWPRQGKRQLSPVPEWASPQATFSSSFSSLQEKHQLPARFICLFPGSVWKTKQWTEAGFIEVGQKLSQEGHFILVMGGPGEEELAQRIAQQIPNSKSLAGQTSLQESLSLLARASVVITNDSAGQHMAALVQAATVSIFGPTVLDFGYRPWNSKAIVVERKGLGCRPCGKHGHHKCPIGTHECMKSIQAAEVLKAVHEWTAPSQSL